MGQRGPKPKLKILPGSPGRVASGRKQRIRRGVPKCPPEINGVAAEVWAQVSTALDAAGLLAECDCGILAAYCLAYQDMMRARSILEADGPIYREPIQTSRGESKRTRPREHPAVKLLAEASRRVERFAAALGLTPASRAKLESDGPADTPATEGNKVVAIRERFRDAT